MEKIKLFLESEKGKNILTIIIVFLVGMGAFELGRLSKENDSNSLKIEYNGQDLTKSIKDSSNTINSQNGPILAPNYEKSAGNYFASKRGKKYYPSDCSAGKSIKQENKIYFNSSAEAEKAGYSLSGSCQ